MLSTRLCRTKKIGVFPKRLSRSIQSYDGPVVDSHFHFFNPNTVGYGLKGNVPEFYGAQYDACAQGIDIVGSVHLQAEHSVGETNMCHEEAEKHPKGFPNTIIAGIQLKQGPEVVEKEIREHKAASHRFKGIRDCFSYEIFKLTDTPRLLMLPEFRKAYSLLDRYDLSFDATGMSGNIPDLIDLVHEFPRIPVVAAHFLGGAGIEEQEKDDLFQASYTVRKNRGQVESEWRERFKELSNNSNIFAKLSAGLADLYYTGTEAKEKLQNKYTDADLERLGISRKLESNLQFPVEANVNFPDEDVEIFADCMLPYVAHTISCFGVDRCMWGSNFPPDGVWGLSFFDNWRAYAICLDKLRISQTDQKKIMCDNAIKFYKMEDVKIDR